MNDTTESSTSLTPAHWNVEIEFDHNRQEHVVLVDDSEIGSYRRAGHTIGLRMVAKWLADHGVDLNKVKYQRENQSGSYRFQKN